MQDRVVEENIKPNGITFDVTDRCQLKCVTCTRWLTKHSDVIDKELTTQEWKDAMLKLRNWLGEGAGFCVSGGEPFLRSDLLELIEYAKSIGLKPSTMTNAFSISNKLEDIARSPLDGVNISLNAINNNDVHDWSRGIKGSCKVTTEAILKLNEIVIREREYSNINIATIFMPENVDEIIPLAQFVHDNKLRGIMFQLQDDKDSFHAYDEKSAINIFTTKMSDELTNKYKEVAPKALKVLDRLVEMKKEGYVIYNSFEQLELMKNFFKNPSTALNGVECSVGETNFAIDPYGDVRICFNLKPIGNIKNADPEELWKSRNATICRNSIKQCKMFCRILNCNFQASKTVFNKHFFDRVYKNVLSFAVSIVRR